MKLRLFLILATAILLAGLAPATQALAADSGCHVVQPGENLTQIAARYGVTVAAIVQANGLVSADLIYVGQCLKIPGKQPAQPAGCVTTHVVKNGEYLKAIAARYKVTVDAIVRANNLRNPNLIYPGQRLRIPCKTTPQPTPAPSTGPWKGEYWANRLLSGSPKFVRNDKDVNFDWGAGKAGTVGPDNFSVRWTRKQQFAAGKFRFHVEVDDGVRLFVDGELLIDQWHDSAPQHYTADRQLGAGYHKIQIDYYEHTGRARIKFWVEQIDVPPTNAWLAEYFGNRMFEPPALVSRLEPKIDYDWGKEPPIARFRSDDFAVRWTRNVFFEAGDYRFTVTVDDGVQVLIDGQLIIDEWHDSNGATYFKDVHLTRGTHRIRVKYYEAGGFAKIKFGWAKASALTTPFRGEYFNNTIAQGTTVLVRDDAAINFDWGNKSPAPGVTADYFSVEWNGDFYFKEGVYRFTATADDGIRVFLDLMPIIDQWRDSSVRTYWVDVAVTEGNHWIKVEYYERTGLAVAKLSWQKK